MLSMDRIMFNTYDIDAISEVMYCEIMEKFFYDYCKLNIVVDVSE